MRLSVESETKSRLNSFIATLEDTWGSGETEKGEAFYTWVKSAGLVLDGQPFSFDFHEYLIEPYQDNHPNQVEEKAAQLGLTSKAILRVLHAARFRGFKGILYLFPSRTDVLEFSKGRVTPLIEDNPKTIGRWIKDTDSAGLKQVWKTFLYLRGMQSRVGLKSVPADFIVFDELDEAPQKMVDMALERMGHSEFKESLMLSNPTMPDYGIDKEFQQTDQRYWLLKCGKCGEYVCMEDTFPNCLLEVGGRVIRACTKCHGELNPSIGEWVAKRPEITERRGRHYSQLFSHFVSPSEILTKFRTTDNLTEFYNLKIGIAYVEAKNRISVEQVYALCGSAGIPEADPGPCSMGIDQGKDLHVVIGKEHPDLAGQIVYLGIHKDWEDLEGLMRRFNCFRCVIDGLPDQNKARGFAAKFPGKVFLNYYSESQKGPEKWNEQNMTVSSNRTETLDACGNQIMEGKIVIPRKSQMVEEFALHCHNIAKRLEEDLESGSKRYVYVRLGPDHFRHALNYETMARKYGAGSALSGCLD
jgi:hypothetical protein